MAGKTQVATEDNSDTAVGGECAEGIALAMRCLARREYAIQELVTRLIQGGISEADAVQAVEYCRQRGWQDDARMAVSFLRSHWQRGHGPLWAARDLKMRGLSALQVEAALQIVELDWITSAVMVATKKVGNKDVTQPLVRKRILQALLRRGFTMQQAKLACELCEPPRL